MFHIPRNSVVRTVKKRNLGGAHPHGEGKQHHRGEEGRGMLHQHLDRKRRDVNAAAAAAVAAAVVVAVAGGGGTWPSAAGRQAVSAGRQPSAAAAAAAAGGR